MPPSSATQRPASRKDFAALGLIGLLACLFFHEMTLGGQLLVMRDAVFDFVPWRRFISDCITNDGVLPLWNPYSSCGVPFVGYPELGLFYPPNLALTALSPAAALRCFTALHLFLAGLFMYCLVRQWTASTLAALFAAIAFMFNGNLVARVEFLSRFSADVWLPCVILFVHLSLAGPSLGRALALAVVLACVFLAGDPESFTWTCTAGGLYSTALALRKALAERRASRLVLRLMIFPVALAVAMGLSLTQLLPTLELIPFSARAASLGGLSELGSLRPAHLTCFLLPRCFGHPGYGRFVIDTVFEFWQVSFYIGWLPLVGALVAVVLACRPRVCAPRTASIYLAALAALSVLYALGVHGPLYPFLYEHVPLLRSFRWPAKIMSVCTFALTALSGLGVSLCMQRCARRWNATAATRLAWVSIAALLFDQFMFNREIHPSGDPAVYLDPPETVQQLLPKAGVDRVWSSVHTAQQYLYAIDDNGVLSRARNCLVGYTGLPFRIFTAWGGGSLRIDRYCELRAAGDGEHADRVHDLLSVRYSSPAQPCRDYIFEGSPPLHYTENPDRLPRAYLVSNVQVEPDDKRALERILAKDFDVRREVVLAQPAREIPPKQQAKPLRCAANLSIGANDATIRAETDRAGLLVLTDVHHPGWRAYDNGERRQIYRANHILRAVSVHAGSHRVRFAYCPRSFMLGLLGSLLTVAALVAYAADRLVRRP